LRLDHTFFALLLLGSLLLPLQVWAIDAPALGSEEIKLSADSLVFDKEKRQYSAHGSVDVVRGALHLTAGEALFDESSGDIFCSGDVQLVSPTGTMNARALRYNFANGTGVLSDGRLAFSNNSMFLRGEEIERFSESKYLIHNGSFTTCTGDTPAWKISANELDIELGAFAQAKHAFFYLHDIPVLYLPYIAYPAKTQRSSGFLLPDVGFSNRLGKEIVLPWYQVIDTNQDVTLTLDYMSQIGVGTGAEYRYLLRRSQPGTLMGNYITGLNGEPERYIVAWEHNGYLPGDVRLVADAEYTNKPDYYNLFGRTADIYTTDYVVSDLYLSRAWGHVNLTGLTRYTRALYADNKPVLQTLPEVRLTVMPTRLADSPLLYSLTAESTYYWRRQGEKGGRLRLLPVLQTDVLSTRYLAVLPTVAWKEQVYWVGGEPIFAGRPEYAVATSTRFGRVYGSSGERSAWQHVIEPQLSYKFAPGRPMQPIPQFDMADEFSPVNLLHGQIDNRFTLRHFDADGRAVYRDVFSLSFGADYDIHEERRTLTLPGERRHPLSPLQVEAIVRPTDDIYLRGRGDFALEQQPGLLESWAVWGGYHDKVGNGLLLNYSYQRNDFEYVSGGIDIALLDPLYLGHETRYDLISDHNLENRTSIEYRGSCWSLAGSWLERTGERQFYITFSLSGLTGKTVRQRSASVADWL